MVRYLFVILLLAAGCGGGNEVNKQSADMSRDDTTTFQYKLHKGLDCGMIQDCGFVISIDDRDTLRYWKDTGRLELQKEVTVTQEDKLVLADILNRLGFAALPQHVPHADSRRGARTITITSIDPAAGDKTVTIFADETEYPFPDSFLPLQQELEAFLLSKAGVATGIYLDTTPRKP